MIDWEAILRRINRDISTGRITEFEGVKLSKVKYPTIKAMLHDLYRVRFRSWYPASRYLCVSKTSATYTGRAHGIETFPTLRSGKRTDTYKHAIINMRGTEKLTSDEIARRVGCGPSTVTTVLRKAGMEWQRRTGGSKPVTKDPATIKRIMKLRLEDKRSAVDVALMIGCSASSIQKIWRENGLWGPLPREKKWNSTHAG